MSQSNQNDNQRMAIKRDCGQIIELKTTALIVEQERMLVFVYFATLFLCGIVCFAIHC